MQTQSSGISRSIRGQITERNEVFYLQIERSDGSMLSLNSRDHAIGSQTVNSQITGRTVTNSPFLAWTHNSLTLAYGGVDYDPDNLGDWMAGAYWLHATGDWRNGQIDGIEVGAIADGPEFPANASNLPDSSTASYRGDATGLYASEYGTDSPVPGSMEIGEYVGDFRAIADFEASTVSGSITNIYATGYLVYPDGRAVSGSGYSDITIGLDSARIGTGERITGNVSPSSPSYVITSSNGSWGSQLSSINDASGNPRAMGGTHGGSVTTSGGSEVSYIGVHYGTTGRF